MTPSQRHAVRLSEVRERLNAIGALEGDDYTDEIRSEEATLQTEYKDLERRYRSALLVEEADEQAALESEPDTEQRERIELRSRANLGQYLVNALRGRAATGAEAELQDAAGIGDGIPLELWDVPTETRADAPTGAPGTVGVNLDPIRPMVFANSIAPRLGIDMPRVGSGTYATATITTALSSGAKGKSADTDSTAATFTATTATPKRVSARLSVTLEDIAAVGQANFESALRENAGAGAVRRTGRPGNQRQRDRAEPHRHIPASYRSECPGVGCCELERLRIPARGWRRWPVGQHHSGRVNRGEP